jgi:hypothetical protein
MRAFEEVISKSISEAFKRMLSEKHLYQVVELDLTGIPKIAEEVRNTFKTPLTSTMRNPGPMRPSVEQVIAMGFNLAGKTWIPQGASFSPAMTITHEGQQFVQFDLPTINTFCTHCQDRWPFNPVFDILASTERNGQSQSFYLGYQCQQCKGAPVRFLISRDGVKIRMAGREPIEVLPVPKVLPKVVSKFYSDAQIAHHAGQTLAGLFLLRTFVEQFWRTLPTVKELIVKQPRATGDEQGEIYQKTLPTDFKDRFPSLSEIYGKLSAVLHEAKADSQLFDESSAKVIKHFEARRLYEL